MPLVRDSTCKDFNIEFSMSAKAAVDYFVSANLNTEGCTCSAKQGVHFLPCLYFVCCHLGGTQPLRSHLMGWCIAIWLNQIWPNKQCSELDHSLRMH